MAVTATINVSGIAALQYNLVDTTTFYFTNAVDGQILTLTLQQDATGSRTVVSGNCPGIMQPAPTAGVRTAQRLRYDAVNNAWGAIPQQLYPGSMALNSTTTSTTISWGKGVWLITSSSTITFTITNPVAGPPGVGNDGEVMTFLSQAAGAIKITMGTTQTINGTSTSLLGTGANGNSLSLQAWGGKVYIQSIIGAFTLS